MLKITLTLTLTYTRPPRFDGLQKYSVLYAYRHIHGPISIYRSMGIYLCDVKADRCIVTK